MEGIRYLERPVSSITSLRTNGIVHIIRYEIGNRNWYIS